MVLKKKYNKRQIKYLISKKKGNSKNLVDYRNGFTINVIEHILKGVK